MNTPRTQAFRESMLGEFFEVGGRVARPIHPDAYRKAMAFAAGLELELQHCKASHAEVVKRCAILRQRHDLPVDRIPAYNELVRLQETLAGADAGEKINEQIV